jgi:hypothetical protein
MVEMRVIVRALSLPPETESVPLPAIDFFQIRHGNP